MAYSGKYKGVTFRSILELSVIRHLEDEGLVLGKTMLYESTRLPYGNRRVRTYIVDITLPEIKTLIEIKPTSKLNVARNLSKREGAEKWCLANGWTYVIITEQELAQCGRALTLDDASKIPEVELTEKALRALRRKSRRAAKKRVRKMRTDG